MEVAAVNVRMFAFSSQRAKVGDTLSRPQPDELHISNDPIASAGDKHKTRSISWLTPHRRKDSGISISTKSSKSTRVSSTATATSISSKRSSSSSRLSRESDLFDSSRIASIVISDQSAPSELSSGLRSPSYPPPKRPDRPQESLFDSPIVYEADEADEAAEAAEADRNADYVRATSLDDPVRRRSRELLGFSLDAIRAPSPDIRKRLSLISVAGSESSGPSYHSILPNPSNRNHQHQKTLSETIATTYLSRKVSSASTRSMAPGSPSLSMSDGSTTKQSKSARWTLTESMADIFKSQKKSLKPKADPKSMTPARIEAIWNHQDTKKSDEHKKKENKEHGKKKKTDKKSLIGSPKLAELLRNTSTADGEVPRPDPVRRPDGQSTIPRGRAIPFEIAIPPPPMSALYNHNTSSTPEPKSPLAQQMVCPNLDETRQEADGEMKHESEEALSGAKRTGGGVEEDSQVKGSQVRSDAQRNLKASEPQIFVIPPPKHQTRFASRAPTLPNLPPIPEGFRAQADNKFLKPWPQPSHKRSRSLSQVGVKKGDRVYLKSTPFTLTNPGFRHGPITFQKSEMKRYSTGTLLAESHVDWTAFQAAIGGVGDLSEVFPAEATGELESEEENQLADEMTAWFAEFGFETHGELIGAEKSPKRYYDRLSWDSVGSLGSTSSVPSTVKTEAEEELQTPVVACSQPHESMYRYDAMKLLGDQKEGGVYESTMDAAKQQRLLACENNDRLGML